MRGATNEIDTNEGDHTDKEEAVTFATRASTFRKSTAPNGGGHWYKVWTIQRFSTHRSQAEPITSSTMIKIACIVVLMAAAASAGVISAPLVAAPAAIAAVPAPIVTARSSQVIARNYNTFAAAPLAAYTAAVPAAVHAAVPAAVHAAVPAAVHAPFTLAHAAPLPYAALTYAAL
ncbi:hypothetical protein ANTQUA_LOCUS9479 [Anthophora quadrimaculata]